MFDWFKFKNSIKTPTTSTLCDVCLAMVAIKDTTTCSKAEFEKLVNIGFEPDRAFVQVPLGVLDISGDSDCAAFFKDALRDDRKWRELLAWWRREVVANHKTDWVLCNNCKDDIERFNSNH